MMPFHLPVLPRPLRLVTAALVLAGLAASLGCGGTRERPGGPGPPPVVPFTGFFQGQIGPDIYLFASLHEKQQFDLEPLSLEYTEFISRTGQRVYVVSGPEPVVASIAAGYERAVDTALTRAGTWGAPPPAGPRMDPTRRGRPPTEPPAPRPELDEGATPIDQLGPTGDQPPREADE